MKLFVCLLAATSFAGSAVAQAVPVAQSLVNRRAPSFSLPDSNFVQHDILDYRGKWLILEFLMTSQQNCATCKDITKRLDALMAKHAAKLAVLGIANTPPETQDTIKAFAAETKTKIPIVFDASMVAMSYFKATPQRPQIDPGHLFLINPQGNIIKDWVGGNVGATFDKDVETLMAGGKLSTTLPEEKTKSSKAKK
jgi:peroxiredoxin